MTKSRSRKKLKRRRAYVRRRLTKSQQKLAEQYIPLANRWIWERALRLPQWIQDTVGSDGFIEAALTATTEAALKYDSKKSKSANGFPTYLFWRCRLAFTQAVHSTLRQIGANPNDSGIPQRSGFYYTSMQFQDSDESHSDLVDPRDESPAVDYDPKISIHSIIRRVSCPLGRKVLKMRFVQSQTLEQVARQMNVSKEWVRILQHRATEQLESHDDLRDELNRYLLGSPSPSDILKNGKTRQPKRRRS